MYRKENVTLIMILKKYYMFAVVGQRKEDDEIMHHIFI